MTKWADTGSFKGYMAWLEREDLTQWAEKSKRNPRKLDTVG